MSSRNARSLAAEAIASGEPAIARSFRFHRRRGPLCGRGYCFQCECATPAGRVLACQTPAGAPNARVSRHDPLRLLGRIAEAWPPWFYERRFLRGEVQRRLFLEAIRHASSAARLGSACPARPPIPFEEEEADIVVVGSGEHAPDGARVVDAERGELAVGVYADRVLGVVGDTGLRAITFDRLVLATGSYERLPPVPGNDLPGVVGLEAARRYGDAAALRPGTRIAVWAPASQQQAVEELARDLQLEIVWVSEQAPRALGGRTRVDEVRAERSVACDLFVIGVSQPAIELALQAGAEARLTEGELPILAVTETPTWLELAGAAARTSSGVPEVRQSDEAFACLCEDVRVKDLRQCVAQGFRHPELVKRRTGAMTGPCQGKLCAAAVLSVLREERVEAAPTTARPLSRPVTLAELAAHA